MKNTLAPILVPVTSLVLLASSGTAQLGDPVRSVSTFAQTYNLATDFSDTEQASDDTELAGEFSAEFTTTATAFVNAVEAIVAQESYVDVESGSFEGQGHAVSTLYVQGTGVSNASSTIELSFAVNGAARVEFDRLVLTVDDQFQTLSAHAPPGDASAFVELRDQATEALVFVESLALDDAGTTEQLAIEDVLTIPLDAGAYSVRVRAQSSDATDGIIEVEYSLAAASFDVSGTLVPSLEADVPEISLAAGGTQTLDLDAGPDFAGDLFLLLGSASGTSPGLNLPGGFNLALNPDPYFFFSLANPNVLPFANSLGTLDAAGRATAAYSLPASTDPTLAGAVLDHAYVALDPGTLAVELVSTTAGLTLLP